MKKIANAYAAGPYVVALVSGLGLTATGYWLDGSTYGSGFEQAKRILVPPTQNDTQCRIPMAQVSEQDRIEAFDDIPAYWFLLKALATWFSYWTGIPGGIFAPTISVGTGIGRFMHSAFVRHMEKDIADSEPLSGVICMTAYFAGVTQSPITSFAILTGFLPTRDTYLTAMLCAAVLGWASSRLIAPSPLYSALSSSRLPPLPPESLECDLRNLPPPQYVSKDASSRLAHYVEVSHSAPSA